MIERLAKKFQIELVEPAPDKQKIKDFADFTLPSYEKTEYGWQILPDTAKGAGPIYFSLIKKI